MFCFLVLVSLVFLCCLAVWFLTFCLLPGFLSALPSGYCSPIKDHACLPEYSSALPSIYLFASCSTLPVFLTMPLNKSLHADPHVSRLVSPVTDPGESAPPKRPRDSVLPEHSLGSAPPERPQASAPPEHPPRLWISPRNLFGPPSPRIYHGRLNSLPWSLRPYMLSLSLVSQFLLGPSLLPWVSACPGGRLLHQLRTGGLLLRHGGLLPRLLCPGGLLSRLFRPGGLLSRLLHLGGLLSRLLRPGGLLSRLLSPGGLLSHLLRPGGLLSRLLRLGTLLCSLCLGPYHFHMYLALRPSPSSTSTSPPPWIVWCLERLEAAPWGGGLCHESGL